MLRVGEPIQRNVKYHYRPSIYGLIIVGDCILLTEQNGNEIQLPGGGVDKGEHYLHALTREVCEETGWKYNQKGGSVFSNVTSLCLNMESGHIKYLTFMCVEEFIKFRYQLRKGI